MMGGPVGQMRAEIVTGDPRRLIHDCTALTQTVVYLVY
jgi:hypothetical protein